MSVWKQYQARLEMHGGTSMRDTHINRGRAYLSRKLPDSLSWHSALVDGTERQLAIINSDNLDQKTVCTMPGETILCGAIVEWMDNHWLVTELDANTEIYTRAIMRQCNYVLKWIDPRGKVLKRWCIVEDGTKYLTGESVNRYNENGMVLGDTRISVTLTRDEYTAKLNRNSRFLIDDPLSRTRLAYRITKPFKIGGVYNGHGAMVFVMTEVESTDDDNFDLMIADYYKYFPRMRKSVHSEKFPDKHIPPHKPPVNKDETPETPGQETSDLNEPDQKTKPSRRRKVWL